MSKKHWGRGFGKIDADDGGDIAGDNYDAGRVDGLKRAMQIVCESPNRTDAYHRLKTLVANYGRERRRAR